MTVLAFLVVSTVSTVSIHIPVVSGQGGSNCIQQELCVQSKVSILWMVLVDLKVPKQLALYSQQSQSLTATNSRKKLVLTYELLPLWKLGREWKHAIHSVKSGSLWKLWQGIETTNIRI